MERISRALQASNPRPWGTRGPGSLTRATRRVDARLAMKKRKGVGDENFGGLPDDEVEDLDEDEVDEDELDDDLDDLDDDELGDEYEEEEYDEDELDDEE